MYAYHLYFTYRAAPCRRFWFITPFVGRALWWRERAMACTARRCALLLSASSSVVTAPQAAPDVRSEALVDQMHAQLGIAESLRHFPDAEHDVQRGAAYVLRNFPDDEHDVAITLSQSDAAKLIFRMSIERLKVARGDERALQTVYGLLVEGAQTEPGAIDNEAGSPLGSSRFPGGAGISAAIRRQLLDEFGAEPLTNHAITALELSDFGSDEIGHALDALWPDGGAGSEYGESFARFAGAAHKSGSVHTLAKEEL